MNLGLAIKRSRMLRENAVRQKDMAEAVGITQTYLSQVEAGKKEPSPRVLAKIADHLGLPVVALHVLATEESDIKPDRVDFFRELKPLIEKLILG